MKYDNTESNYLEMVDEINYIRQHVHEICEGIKPPQPVKKFSKDEIAELEFKMKAEGKL